MSARNASRAPGLGTYHQSFIIPLYLLLAFSTFTLPFHIYHEHNGFCSSKGARLSGKKSILFM